jgi:mannosyltransferase
MTSPVALQRRPVVTVGAITVTTAAACFVGVGGRSVWGDEAVSISYALGPLRGLFNGVSGDPNMSLYYAALWVWTRVFGDGVIAVRALSILFAAATLPIVYALGSRLFGRAAGLFAALALATNAFFLNYAQEARGYSLVTLMCALSMYFFVDALDRARPRSLVGYVVASALAFYAHFFAVFVTLVQLVYLLLIARREALARRWLAAYTAIGLLVAPIAYHALAFGENPIRWIPRPGVHALVVAARSIGGNGTAPVLVALAVLAVGLSSSVRSKPKRFAVGLVAAWLLAPPILSFLVSQVHPMFLPRYLVVSLPALALLLGAAVTSVRPQPLGVALGAAVLIAASTSLYHWYRRPPLEDWKAASAYLLSHARPNEGVVYQMSWAVPALSYYELRSGNRLPLRFGERDDAFPVLFQHGLWLVLYQDAGADGLRLRRSARARGLRRVAVRSFRGDFELELFAR